MKKRNKKKDKKRKEIFEQAVKKNTPRIYKMIYNMTNNYEITGDLTQDVFLNAWKGFESFRGDSSIYTWLYRIALNRVFRYRRDQVRSGETISVEDIMPPETKKNPEKFLEKKDESQVIKKAVYLLPKKYQEVLVLRYYEDMDYSTIAQTLKIPIGTVRSRLHRALAKLEEILRAKR